jgi:hypothetical protein
VLEYGVVEVALDALEEGQGAVVLEVGPQADRGG